MPPVEPRDSSATPQRLDWIGPPTPLAPEDLIGQARAPRLQCFQDWAAYLDSLASRPLATALILAAPPPAEAYAFLDWFVHRGVLLGTTSPVLRAETPEAAWLTQIRLLITDAEPPGALSLPGGAHLACIGGGVLPRLAEQCHIDVRAELLPVLQQHARRISAQHTIDRLSRLATPTAAPDASSAAASPTSAAPSAAVITPASLPQSQRRRLRERLRALATNPLLGPLLRWGWALFKSADTRQLVAGLERQQTHHQHEYQALLERVHRQADQLQQQQAQQQAQQQQLQQTLQQQAEQLQQHAEYLQQQLELLKQQGADHQAYQQATAEQLTPLREGLGRLHLPEGRLPALLAEPLPDFLRRARESLARENNPALFADLGNPDLCQLHLGELAGADRHAILHQQYAAYRPHLLPAQGPVLDLGCGMGDWLAYLREHNEQATGIDTNAYEIERCRQRGLDAECADGLGWLEAHPETYALITLMQVIEHIPRDRLGTLLAALAGALRPGGRLLLETLNPAHPLALSMFYNDPTHQRPLPVEYLAFLAQIAGLAPEQVLYTYPVEVVATSHALQTPHYVNYGLLLRKP